MKIIVVGSGKVGYTIAESLAANNDVTIIDKCAESLKKADENLDVLCIKGNGASASTLLEAGVNGAHLLIAVTSSDEVNMVCCLAAKKLGAAHTAARIRDPQYAKELVMLKEEVGLDLIINPEHAAADEIARSLSFPYALNIENFAKGKVRMVTIKVVQGMSVIGSKLKDVVFKAQNSVLVGAVDRNGEITVPDGDFAVAEGDILYLIGRSSNIYNFCDLIVKGSEKCKNIMILGGGRIAYYLTNMLTDMGMKVKIIEKERERCAELSELLPHALVINADGTDEEVLISEDIKAMDGFIAVTGIDEENLLSSLLAKQNGAKKIVTKISRTNYMSIAKNLGITNIICPKLITADQILKYIEGGRIESLYTFGGGRAKTVEFIAGETDKILNIPIKDLKLPKDTIIATIARKNEVVIPHGNDIIKKGDRVIVITKHVDISCLDELSYGLTGGIQNELRNGIKKFGDIINL